MSPSSPRHLEDLPRREIQAFSLYRVLVALLMLALLASPLNTLTSHGHARLPAIVLGVAYLLVAIRLAVHARHGFLHPDRVFYNSIVDIVMTVAVIHAIDEASIGIALSLVVNLTAAATLVTTTRAVTLSALASLLILGEQGLRLSEGLITHSPVEVGLLITCYAAMGWIGCQQGERGRHSQQLVEQRSAEVANLFEINQMILRRMRTGVLVIDRDEHITLANEAALALLDGTPQSNTPLHELSPVLSERLRRWRGGWPHEQSPLHLPGSGVAVQPRFVSLMADSELALVFLDDTSIASRRAESLTLSTLGRFSASLAHEIRNPLTAISYASQLLAESPGMEDEDKRLVQIITHQCQRTNNIVESVLGMARRERANPENIELGLYLPGFVEEYRQSMASAADTLEFIHTTASVTAVVDPRHLNQVLTILVHNALRHGRQPGKPAVVRLRLSALEKRAVIDCIDLGPGLTDTDVESIFKPFYTTDEHGTGLGLYLARELCEANHGQLVYHAHRPQGACLRITLPQPGHPTFS